MSFFSERCYYYCHNYLYYHSYYFITHPPGSTEYRTTICNIRIDIIPHTTTKSLDLQEVTALAEMSFFLQRNVIKQARFFVDQSDRLSPATPRDLTVTSMPARLEKMNVDGFSNIPSTMLHDFYDRDMFHRY